MMRQRGRRYIDRLSILFFCSLLFAACLSLSVFAQAEQPAKAAIQFVHEDYPPFIYRSDSRVRGQIAEIMQEIAVRAGIEVQWREVTFRRLVREIRFGKRPVCAAGYNHIYADFEEIMATAPISWFRSSVLAVRADDVPMFEGYGDIDAIVRNQDLRGAFLAEVDYTGIDETIFGQRHVVFSGTDTELATMVARGRVHYAPMSREQVEYLQKQPGTTNLIPLSVAGMRPPRTVSIICSHNLDEHLWQALNKAILPIGEAPKE